MNVLRHFSQGVGGWGGAGDCEAGGRGNGGGVVIARSPLGRDEVSPVFHRPTANILDSSAAWNSVKSPLIVAAPKWLSEK